MFAMDLFIVLRVIERLMSLLGIFMVGLVDLFVEDKTVVNAW
jgi:hypothetical protein